ncbi:MAG: HEAT repeat domain-containing protein [Candidatus Omnitrophota bacterium]
MRKIATLTFILIVIASLSATARAQEGGHGRSDDRYSKIIVTTKVVEALGKIGDPQTRDVLTKALKSKEFFIRASAAQALGRLQDKESIPLLKPLTADKNYLVRVLTVVALVDLGYKDAEETLFASLKDEDPAVRAVAVDETGRLGDNFLAAMNEMLPKEKENSVRAKIITQLGAHKYKPALPMIRKALKDEDAQVRTVACSAIAAFEDKESIPRLIEGLSDEDVLVRAAATGALGILGDRGQIGLFRKGMDEEDSILKASSYSALANLGELDILPVLLERILDPGSPTVIRTGAAQALVTLKPRISGLVREALEETEVLYDISLLENLQFDYQVNGRNLKLIITEALKDGGNPLHLDAPLILYTLGAEMSLPALRSALSQENAEFVATAAYSLGEFRDKEATKYLIQVFEKYGI